MNNDKPSPESSHSPTEQPGDAKHIPGGPYSTERIIKEGRKHYDELVAELEQLRSERDKMREALEKITDYVDPLSAHNAFYIMREIAKSALSGGSKQ